MATKRAREEDEKLKGLTAKEREEVKRIVFRLTGPDPRGSVIINLTSFYSQAGSCSSVIGIWRFRMTT